MRERSRHLLDVAPALGLAALGLLDIFVGLGSDFPGPALAHAALALASTLPLAWRRRAPVAVMWIVGGATSIWTAALYPSVEQGPFVGFVALLVAFYSLGAHAGGRRALRVLPLVALGVALDGYSLASGRSIGNTLPPYIFFGGAWVLGRIVRKHQLTAERLRELADQLGLEREERARLAVALERGRIARELHDVIAHAVSVMVVQASVERRLLAGGRPSTSEALESIERTGREALVELRRLLGVLRKTDDETSLAPQPSLAHLEALVEQVREAGLPVSLRLEGEIPELPPGLELSAYRIVQEALTNALKHAGQATAEVVVRFDGRELQLEVSDDGPGDGDGGGGGHGLAGMRERVALFGGALDAGRRDSGGWTLRARLPLELA